MKAATVGGAGCNLRWHLQLGEQPEGGGEHTRMRPPAAEGLAVRLRVYHNVCQVLCAPDDQHDAAARAASVYAEGRLVAPGDLVRAKARARATVRVRTRARIRVRARARVRARVGARVRVAPGDQAGEEKLVAVQPRLG